MSSESFARLVWKGSMTGFDITCWQSLLGTNNTQSSCWLIQFLLNEEVMILKDSSLITLPPALVTLPSSFNTAPVATTRLWVWGKRIMLCCCKENIDTRSSTLSLFYFFEVTTLETWRKHHHFFDKIFCAITREHIELLNRMFLSFHCITECNLPCIYTVT